MHFWYSPRHWLSERPSSHTLQSLESCVFSSPTGRQICIQCLKLRVSFRKRASHYRALLRGMTIKDKASYGSLPPCTIGKKGVFASTEPCLSRRFLYRYPRFCVSHCIPGVVSLLARASTQCCSVAGRCSALQCVAVRCSALQCVAVHCGVLHSPAMTCQSILQCLSTLPLQRPPGRKPY